MVEMGDELAYFQAITGLSDADLCTDILAAHGWDLELAIAAFTGGIPSTPEPSAPPITADVGEFISSGPSPSNYDYLPTVPRSDSTSLVSPAPNLASRVVTLPFSVINGGLWLVRGAVGLGLRAASGALSYSADVLGLGLMQVADSSPAASESREFLAAFEGGFGGRTRPNFVSEGFNDALQRSRHAYKLLFVYLHSPEHPDSSVFCERTLCNEVLSAFVNENFVSWGGSIRCSEGFKMSNSFKASRFPFCAVVMAAANQKTALLQQIEGPKTVEEMIAILEKVLEETGPVLVAARLEAEERRNNMRLREEQDAAYTPYRAALEADQARERQRSEEQERLGREAAEVERKRKEEEEAREREAWEAAEREAVLARRRQEKALSLGAEPEKGPDVTQVLVRFPAGERKGRRFQSTTTIQSIYNYVDTLDCLNVEDYNLVSNFPRTVYGPEKRSLTLKEAGLHPQASLFVEVNT